LMDPIWVYVFVEIDGFDGVNACVMVNGRMWILVDPMGCMLVYCGIWKRVNASYSGSLLVSHSNFLHGVVN
jgi:hypothetical protein